MKTLNLLIKPASSSCNLKCKYCFYCDVAENREIKNYGIMTDSTLENMVKKAFEEVQFSINFAFQGGEPTLAGIEYFKKFHSLIDIYNVKNITTNFAIQTNGTTLNKTWISLFKKYNYLVGISLDGNKEIHDMFRVDSLSEGTFTKILRATKILKKENIDFNILCVVNKLTAQNGKLIYNFFKNNNFRYYQFIPCLDSLFSEEKKDFTLTAQDYEKFLTDTFELWYKDILSGKKISIRYFDNLIKIILGEEPEACDMIGHCNINAVLEADGSVYPCDFYVLDKYKLGNINDSSYTTMLSCQKEKEFLFSSFETTNKCKICQFFKLCRGGCRRHKEINSNGIYENKFCSSYLLFFKKNMDKLQKTANYIISSNSL